LNPGRIAAEVSTEGFFDFVKNLLNKKKNQTQAAQPAASAPASTDSTTTAAAAIQTLAHDTEFLA
jgi:hypothetical protein